jgi:hypothetical protein
MSQKTLELLQTGGRSLEEAKAIIKAGHPPEAEGVILVDFDATLYPYGYLFDAPAPLPGAAEFMQAVAAAGYKAIIFTSRLSPRWLESVGQTAQQHIDYITEVCNRDGIPFTDIIGEKVPSIAIYDDKAVRVKDWASIDHSKYGVNL